MPRVLCAQVAWIASPPRREPSILPRCRNLPAPCAVTLSHCPARTTGTLQEGDPESVFDAALIWRACRAALFALLLVSTGAVAGMREPFLLSDVVTRSQKGDSPDSIIRALRTTRTTYALRGSDFGKLREAGVKDDVLDYIQQTFFNDVDLVVRYWSAGETMGRCGPCYPQQVDLGALHTDGSIRQMPPPLRSNPGRPLGLPDWYRTARNHARLGGITVDELRDLMKTGQTEEQLLHELRTRGLIDVIGVGGKLSFSTRLSAGIPGSTMADLHEEGLSDAVLDELQANLLAVMVEHLRLKYLNLGRGAFH